MAQATGEANKVKISERALKAKPSPTLAITAKANQMKKEGHDIVGLGAGEPDFDTPELIKDAAIRALKEGFTKYTPTAGTPELKQAICDKLKKENGLEYSPAEIIVSCGAKHSLYNAIQALIDSGDEVIIPTPFWVSYLDQVNLADGKAVLVKTDDASHFKITADQLEKAITPRTKILILNSPSNPTGMVYSRAELEAIADVVVRRNILVLSDEIYEKMLYGGAEFVSFASLSPDVKALTMTINGVSKAFSMTGWRIGYAAGAKEIVAAMGRIQDHSTSNPTSIAQKGALQALTGPLDDVEKMVAAFWKRRDMVLDLLKQIPGVSCVKPEGAFYVFPSIAGVLGQKTPKGKLLKNSDDVADYLLEDHLVAVVPGSGFGSDTHMRLSYATSEAALKKALGRIKAAFEVLG